MAWDSKASRRRQNSSATSKNTLQTVAPEVIKPKSSHVSDPILQPFLAPSFDAAEYLNATLPSLTTSSIQNNKSQDFDLTELSSQTQTLLSHLSAHTTRLTATLTQQTDEILRSGSRLAYEVEVLRGETLGLSEALTEGLQDDISKFVPGGLDTRLRSSTITSQVTPNDGAYIEGVKDPTYITKLRTLTSVRNRLETVIQTFGDAMSWTFPPSDVSVSSAFLSVSAPEPGSEAHSMEEKGQEISKKLRNEIADLLASSLDSVDGIEAAAKRVEELKELAKVWKGTAEEKGRIKFVESLAKMVEDRHRELMREVGDGKGTHKGENRRDVPKSTETSLAGPGESKAGGGYGFINQLQKMRGGL